MVCIFCGSDTQVTNSRSSARRAQVWRRRQCLSCRRQFTTDELPRYDTAVSVESGGTSVAFSRDTLLLDIYRALGHRSDAAVVAGALCDTAMAQLYRRKLFAAQPLPSAAVAAAAYDTLKRFDKHAAATYRAFHQREL